MQRLPRATTRTLRCNILKNAPLSGREEFRLQRPPPDRCNGLPLTDGLRTRAFVVALGFRK
jgi:hypothetical protein